jgi:parvulin-like peptidyl-prolyl isomerase
MRSLTATVSALACAGLCAFTAFAGAQETKSNVTATIKGKPVSDEQLTSFSMLLESTEGRSPEDRQALIEEYALTQLHNDIFTTVPQDQTENKSPYRFKSLGQRQMLRAELQKHVMTSIKVPRSDMEDWYKKNVQLYQQPEKVHAWHLFMETSPDEPSSAPAKVRQRMEQVKAEADKSTSFGLIAAKYSEAASAKGQGEIGDITVNMPIGPQHKPMNPVLERTLFSLKPGQVSDIVQTSHGLHLLFVSDRTSTRTPTVDDLITSGILPGNVANERLTSEVRKLVTETIEKHKGKAIESTSAKDQLTTATPAFEFNGKTFTIADIESLYGARFTRAYQRVQGNQTALKDLMRQALEDEGMIQAAADAGLDKSGALRDQLELLGKRGDAAKHIQKIIAEAYPVSPQRVQQLYDQQKDMMRQPEAEGSILVIQAKTATSAAEEGKFRELAQKAANDAHEKIKSGTSFEDAASQVASKDVQTSVGKIARHVSGQTTDTLGRAFDQASAGIKEGEVSEVLPFGNDFAIGKLEKRYPGEPVPFERIRPRLQMQAQSESEREAKKDMVRVLESKGLLKIENKAASTTEAK